MPELEIPRGIWRHYRGGYYEVLVVAVHAGTAEHFVIYRSPLNRRVTWARSAKEFLEEVEFYPGSMVPRFKYVRPADRPSRVS
jgi:hypothetical protein